MKRMAVFIVIFCFLLILVGCAQTVTSPIQEPESAGKEAAMSTTSTGQESTTESKSKSEDNSTKTETTDETSLAQTTKPEPAPNHDTDNELMEPVLLDTLKRNCQVTRGSGNFDQTGLAVGETAVNFTLTDINGSELRLSQLLAEKPVLMIFGSFT